MIRVQRVLDTGLVGVYATGSVALAAYEPGRSDVDVALVCADPLTADAKRLLVAALRHEALPCPARGLELVGYTRAMARSGSPEPGFEIELNTGARMSFRVTFAPADRSAADGRFWYGIDRSILHGSGLALFGPPAEDVFADLAEPDLREILAAATRWWLDQGAEAVLAACRALVRIEDGVWLPKAEAGRRLVIRGVAPAGLVADAIGARHGGPPPDTLEAREFQLRVLQALDR